MTTKPYTPGFRYDLTDFLADHAVGERKPPTAAFDSGVHPASQREAYTPKRR